MSLTNHYVAQTTALGRAMPSAHNVRYLAGLSLGKHYCRTHNVCESSRIDVEWVPAISLLMPERIDLIPKIWFAGLGHASDYWRSRVYRDYRHVIATFSGGTYREPGNSEKSSFDDYVRTFERLKNDISRDGVNSHSSVIPVAVQNGRHIILDGSHRVAVAIANSQWVPITVTDRPAMNLGPRYFVDRGTRFEGLDDWVLDFVQRREDVGLLLIWPNGHNELDRNTLEREMRINGIDTFYRVEFDINDATIQSLISIIYAGHSWLGAAEAGFPGARSKSDLVMRSGHPLTMYLGIAQDSAHSRMAKTKLALRGRSRNGQHAYHTSDDTSEVRAIAHHVLGTANRHFLKHGRPNHYKDIYGILAATSIALSANGREAREVVLVGSSVLSMYGIRRPADIDFLNASNCTDDEIASVTGFESHSAYIDQVYRFRPEEFIKDGRLRLGLLGYSMMSLEGLIEVNRRWLEPKKQRDRRLAVLQNREYLSSSLISVYRLRTYRMLEVARRRSRLTLSRIAIFVDERLSIPDALRKQLRKAYQSVQRLLR